MQYKVEVEIHIDVLKMKKARKKKSQKRVENEVQNGIPLKDKQNTMKKE